MSDALNSTGVSPLVPDLETLMFSLDGLAPTIQAGALRERIRAAIGADSPEAGACDLFVIECEDGAVLLRGSVASSTARRRIGAEVAAVEGVAAVMNRLAVRAAG
jgi:osmotically-inducible protein OsmY